MGGKWKKRIGLSLGKFHPTPRDWRSPQSGESGEVLWKCSRRWRRVGGCGRSFGACAILSRSMARPLLSHNFRNTKLHLCPFEM